MSDEFQPLAPLNDFGLGSAPSQGALGGLPPLPDLDSMASLPDLPSFDSLPSSSVPAASAAVATTTDQVQGNSKGNKRKNNKKKGKTKPKFNPEAPDFVVSEPAATAPSPAVTASSNGTMSTNIKAADRSHSKGKGRIANEKPKQQQQSKDKGDKRVKQPNRDKSRNRDKAKNHDKIDRRDKPHSHDMRRLQSKSATKPPVLQDGRYQVPLSAKVQASLAALDESTDSDNTCELCAEEMEVVAVGGCNHRMCHRCSLRMRVLLKKTDCPVCRAPLDKILLTDNVTAVWHDNIGNGLRYDPRWQAYASSPSVHAQCQDLFSYNCQLCETKPFARWNDLRRHVMNQHDRYFCDLCVQHSTRFPSEYVLYTAKDLSKHTRHGDVNSPDGHPECGFCKKRMYDNDTLLKHLKTEHAHCTLCERQGKRFEYYADARQLDKHYKDAHITCPHGCPMVAFLHEIELQQHIVEVHMKESSQMERAKARSLDPSAFFNLDERRSHSAKSRQGRGKHRGNKHAGQSRRQREAEEADEAYHPSMHVPHQAPALDEVEAFPTLGNDATVVPVAASAPTPATAHPQASNSTAASTTTSSASAATPRFASALAGPNFANSSDPALGNAAAIAQQASWPALSQKQAAQRGASKAPAAAVGGYIHPPDFKQRNESMGKAIQQATGTADAFEEFKSLSNAFRSGILTGDEYYTRCSQLLGARMGVIYPELVALLPDLRLQSALVEAYDRHHRAGQVQSLNISTKGGRGAKPKVTVSRGKNQGSRVTWNRCARCGQVLQPRDTQAHAAAHSQEMESDFPSLAALGPRKPARSRGRGGQKPSGGGAWGRR